MSGQKKVSFDVDGKPRWDRSEKPLLRTKADMAAPAGRSRGVAQTAREHLACSSYPALRALRVSFHEGVLTLRGRVPSYHLRQVAWKLVGDLPGVEEFVDRLEVVEELDETSGGAS